MPVSVCDSAVNAAIRESIAASSDDQAIQSKLVASTKRVLLTKIEFEEVNNYSQSVLESLKSKYIVLKPSPNERKSNYPGLEDKEASGQTNQPKDPNQLPSPKRVLFPRENVQIGWKSSGRKWLVGAGMINVGNTCYLNSTLQALFHVPAIANWLISDSGHREKCEDESSGSQGGCIICAMANTLIQSQTNQLGFKPYQVYTKLRLVCKHLIMGRQEDAHEFLRYLVEAMEKAYLQRFRNSKDLDQFSKETTPLNQILGGYLKSAVRCLACGHVSTTFQHFEDLLLDIRKANTIEEALDGYFARERLEDMGYKCESCKKKVSATKQFSLERAPISLCIQLKRFSMMGTKLNKHVAIRPRLDLTPYASKKNTEQLTYKLVSMVTHLGASQHCGHYTAIGLTEAGGYYQFDDSCVRPISIQNVINTNAYIIFYELEDNQQHHRQTSTQVSRDYVDHTTKEVNSSSKLHNGQNGDSEGQQRYVATSTNNSNASLLGINSKLNNKIEYNGGTSSSSSLSAASSSSSIAAGGTFIGPQLPSKTSTSSLNFEANNSRNASNSEYSSADTAIQNGLVTSSSSPSKLVNSPNKMFKLNASSNGNTALTSKTSSTFQSPNQKTNQNLDSKLVIHVKNGNTNSLIGTSPKNTTSNINNSNSNSNGSNHNGKHVDGMKFLTTSNSPAKSLADGENFHLRNGEVKKSTLPSMPKLGSPASPTPSTSNRRPQTPTSNGSHSLQNGFSKSSSINEKLTPVKSLVPYESDDDSNNSEGALQIVESPEHRPTKEHRHHSSHTRSTKFDRTYDSDDSCWSSDSDNCRIKEKQTPPSPPVVKSKTGLWQVTNACINLPSSSSPSIATTSAPPPERKNPFATLSTISSSNFYSNGGLNKSDKEKKFNGNKSNSDPALNKGNEVVDSLLKLSHRGYGAPVLSWNGQKPHVEKEISDEKRQNRKRELDKDEENEMDRGRQKKIKIHGPVGRDNPGYSPFQEYQNQYNSQQRRWNNGGNSNSRYYNGHIYRQNSYQNRNYNNFRRHRFQNRRNGNSGGFHHRRDS